MQLVNVPLFLKINYKRESDALKVQVIIRSSDQTTVMEISMSRSSIVSMYRDLWRAMHYRNKLMMVLIIKLIIIKGLFQFLGNDLYKNTPQEAPAMIAKSLKP